jgi:hypothetical protein
MSGKLSCVLLYLIFGSSTKLNRETKKNFICQSREDHFSLEFLRSSLGI